MARPRFAVCATNYNCAHALEAHLASVYRAFEDLDFEYAVVDNRSRDGSLAILSKWSREYGNFRVRSVRCTMGSGRNLAVSMTTAPMLVIVDTDVIYRPEARDFVLRCAKDFPETGIQAIFLGAFPRAVWRAVGGRRSLNTYEDVDFWLRLHRRGLIRWYPVSMGENVKEDQARGGLDPFSHRYPKTVQLRRLLRREWDLFKTREYEGLNLSEAIAMNSVDLGLGTPERSWVSFRAPDAGGERIRVFGRYCFQILRG